MTLVVHCSCGTDVAGESEDELVSAFESHVKEDHPEQAGELGREQILEMAHEH